MSRVVDQKVSRSRRARCYRSAVRRRLLTVAVFLLAGAVVNVGVAWGCAMWSPLRNFSSLSSEGLGVRNRAMYFHLDIGVVAGERREAGFPLLSLVGYRYAKRSREVALIRPPSPFAVRPSNVLPARPIWPGFAVNTLFYAAVLWPLIPGPFTLRGLIRQRRGLCPKCAYPMGESSVCTECGNELPQRMRATT